MVVITRSFSDGLCRSPMYSHVRLPSAASGRTPEAQAVRAPGVEVVVALVRMAELVDLEGVVVPLEAVADVVPPDLRYVRK